MPPSHAPHTLSPTTRCITSPCVALCSIKNITDSSVRELGVNCPMLQTLNLAACDRVSELGLAYLARGCRDIQVGSLAQATSPPPPTLSTPSPLCSKQVLNVSGCSAVTVRGLKNLIQGLPYVEVSPPPPAPLRVVHAAVTGVPLCRS